MCGTYLNNKNSGKLEISVAEQKKKKQPIREDFIKEVCGVWGGLWTMGRQSLMREEFL